jgi:hypothetical protein
MMKNEEIKEYEWFVKRFFGYIWLVFLPSPIIWGIMLLPFWYHVQGDQMPTFLILSIPMFLSWILWFLFKEFFTKFAEFIFKICKAKKKYFIIFHITYYLMINLLYYLFLFVLSLFFTSSNYTGNSDSNSSWSNMFVAFAILFSLSSIPFFFYLINEINCASKIFKKDNQQNDQPE